MWGGGGGGGCVRAYPHAIEKSTLLPSRVSQEKPLDILAILFQRKFRNGQNWLILLRGMFLTGEFPEREGKHSLSACSFSQEMSASKMACAPEAKISSVFLLGLGLKFT